MTIKWENKERASAAEAALEHHASVVAGKYTAFKGDADDVTDLLTDLRHLCKREGISFTICTDRAYKNWQAEEAGEG